MPKKSTTNKGGRPRVSSRINTRSIGFHDDVDSYLIALKDATGIPFNTLVNSIIRGYFTQRGAGNGIVLDITPAGTVQVPIQWPKTTDMEN